MTKYSLRVDSMVCSMCEAHVNDAVRKVSPVKKVTSSYSKKQTFILSEQPLDKDAPRSAINGNDYSVGSISSEPYEKRGLFPFGK